MVVLVPVQFVDLTGINEILEVLVWELGEEKERREELLEQLVKLWLVVCHREGLEKELLLESRGEDDDISPATTDALCMKKILE
jgi:hypothetical protein